MLSVADSEDMASRIEVVFRDQWREINVSVSGTPLVVPPGLEVAERSMHRIVYVPARVSPLGSADVLAGSVPLLYFGSNGLQVSYLDIPPPLPLTLTDLMTMWDLVVDLGLPIPSSVLAQGRLLPGKAASGLMLMPELLDRAHAAARQLVASWPTKEDQGRIWRALELPGGREDLPGTDRHAGRFPVQVDDWGLRFPIKSLRRVRRDRRWTSQALHQTAARLVRLVDELLKEAEPRARDTMLQPLHQVAELARPPVTRLDPPFSAWPLSARSCLRAFTMALRLIESTRSSEGAARAPLSHLWRLYEAWTAALCFAVLDRNSTFTRENGPEKTEGAEWLTTWRHATGTRVVLIAQADIGREPRDFGGILPEGLFSVTSTLRPDIIMCIVKPGNELSIIALDAKRRSASSMDPRDAAEAASKYVWGIRLGDSTLQVDVGKAHVTRTLLATTAAPPLMISPRSRIVAVRVLPNLPDTELRDAIIQSLDSAGLSVTS